MPSESFLRLEGGQMIRVGSYLDEFAIPAGQMLDAGYELVVATPQGTKPVLDPTSNSSSSFPSEQAYEDALVLWNTLPSLQSPILLGSLSVENADNPANAVSIRQLNQFSGIFIPGTIVKIDRYE